MAIFKRFEVWMLLFFCLVAVAFVLFTHLTSQNEEEDELGSPSIATLGTNPEIKPQTAAATIQPKTPFAIENSKLTQDGEENWLLELKVRYRNDSSQPLELAAPRAQLVTESGLEVPDFFLAFSEPPVVEPETEEVVDLRYWLDSQHHGQPLQLKIAGDSLEVEIQAER